MTNFVNFGRFEKTIRMTFQNRNLKGPKDRLEKKIIFQKNSFFPTFLFLELNCFWIFG